MIYRTRVSLAVAAALSTGAVALPAQAQDTITVTGTRIKTVDTEATSPVITLDAATIRTDSVRNAEQFVNNLPSVFAGQGVSVSNGSTGTATVNLRGLGASRTLVLMDGRRLPPGSPRSWATDLNQVPVSLIRRVDVLTGGASAVYGSDAMAGVVNFVMNDRFQGIQLDVNHSFYNHKQKGKVDYALAARNFAIPDDTVADGAVTDFSVTMGGNIANGKGNAVVFMGYKKEDDLLQAKRDFSACALSPSGDKFSCGGSSTSFPGRFIDLNTGANYTVADSKGNVRTWGSNDIYNYGPLNYFQRPSERYYLTSLAHYDVTENARLYVQASFHDDSTVAQIAPSGLFGFDASGNNAVKYENPLLSNDWRQKLGLTKTGDTADLLILRRNIEGGGRQDDMRHSSFRMVAGLKGSVGMADYDVFVQRGKVIYQETYKNDFSIARTARAMDVVTDPASGKAVCRSALDGTDPSCVPYDIWKLGAVDPAALAYLATPGFQKGSTTQTVVGGNMAFDLAKFGIKMPTAKEAAGAVIGFERITTGLELSVDTAFETGDLAGQGGPTKGVAGEYSVRDVYGEFRLPLISGRPGAQSVNLTSSLRNSDYSTGPNANSWGVGLDWTPAKGVKVRASSQRAIRGANVIELYTPQSLGLYDNDADPCAGANPSATAEQCARTGVTAAQYGTVIDNPAGQYNALFGGNPNLSPEKGKTITLGAVLQPAKDLTLTVDYFDIKISDAVGSIAATTTLNKCLETGDSAYCSLIQRDRIGTLWATPDAYIMSTNANLASITTRGIDVAADYTMSAGKDGRINFSFIGTKLTSLESEEAPGLGAKECAGYYGTAHCGTPNPKWRHKARANWIMPSGNELALTWRHFGAVERDTLSGNPLMTGPTAAVEAEFAAQNYFDVSFMYPITKEISFRATVSNLLDKDPPIGNTGAGVGNGNTYPTVYDALGRRILLSVTAKY